MRTALCGSVKELSDALEGCGPDSLFRGQVTHYTRPDGSPSLTTSFARHGCMPDLMLKWYHYARQSLQRHVVGWTSKHDMATDQAILQHYGWRSFFLDATGDMRIAAWFACNRFTSANSGYLVEDCYEDPVILISELARFVPTQEEGHIYVFSRKALRAAGSSAVHLSEIATKQGSPRYVRQDAYMIGPVAPSGLDEQQIVAHIRAPFSVLATYSRGLNTAALFPEPHEDPIYRELLAMPWNKIGRDETGISRFTRSLPLPEYKPHIAKHMPATSAMYREFWMMDLEDPSERPNYSYILCGAALYHGHSETDLSMPTITRLLSERPGLIIETDALIYYGMGTLYGKGLMIRRDKDGLIEINELGVDHPGLKLRKVVRFPGVHYRADAFGVWTRKAHTNDCDCGAEHIEHVQLLGRIEECLTEGFIEPLSDGLYVQRGMSPKTDPTFLQDLRRELEGE